MKKLLVVACAGLCSALFADTTLYVKPGGTGAGTSWADAADLATAVATAKTAGTPHALYLAKGMYTPGILEPAPGTSFFGGFAGESMDETPAGRDLTANRTVLSGGNYYWRYGTGNDNVIRGGQKVYLWTDGVFNEPDPTEEEHFWKPNGSLRLINLQYVTATGEKLVLDGLTFSGACVRTYKTPLEVRNCDFWGCYDDFGVVWSQTSMSVTDSTFWGSNGPMISSDGAATTDTLLVSNVVMRSCSATGNGRGFGVYAPSVYLTVADCAFTSNVTAYANGTAPFVSGNDNSKFTIRDSVFRANEVLGGAVYLVWLPNYKAAIISNCLFQANRVVGDRGGSSTVVASVVMAQRTDHTLFGCSFISNVVERTEAVTKAGETTLKAAVVRSTYLAPIRNCTFDGNRVSAVATDPTVTPQTATVMVTGGTDTGAWFGNAFYNNDVGTADIVLADRNGTGTLRHFNTILWNDNVDYVPVAALNANGRMGFHFCDVRNLTTDSWIVERDSILSVDPLASPTLTAAGSILVRKLLADSPARKQGTQLYYESSANRYPVYRDGNTYKRCDTLGTGSMSAPYTPIPDVTGVFPLTANAPDLGPVFTIVKTLVTYTFDLGLRATFDASGLAVYSVELETDDPVAIPAYTVNDGYTLRKWRDEVPARAGDCNKTFKAYYWGHDLEIDAGDDLAEVIAYGATRDDGATIHAGAGDYAVTAALALPTNVVLEGTSGARIVSTVRESFDQSSLAPGPGVSRISGFEFVGGAVRANTVRMDFTDCIFSNATALGAAAAIIAKTNVTIKGCTFLGNTLCLYVSNVEQGSPVSVTDSTFRGNTGNSNGTFFNAGSAWLTIDNCTFEDNTNTVAGCSMMGGSDWCGFYINRSKFVRNILSNATSMVVFPNHTPSSISNSLFLSNFVIGDRGNNSSAVACLVNARRQTHPIVNTAFISNVIDRTEAATKAGVTELRAQLVYTDYYNFLLNDTFVGNVVKAEAADPNVTLRASLFAFSGSLNAGLANLTFKDNVAADGDIFLRYTGGYKASFFNCIFTGGAGYKCVGRLGENTTSANFFNCVANGVPDEDWVTLTNCRTGIPKFCRDYTIKDGVWSLMLDGDSVGRRGGIQVYWDGTGKLAFWNGTGWRRCDDPTSTWQLAEPYTPVSDVYGNCSGKRVVMGAVQDYKKWGLSLIVR